MRDLHDTADLQVWFCNKAATCNISAVLITISLILASRARVLALVLLYLQLAIVCLSLAAPRGASRAGNSWPAPSSSLRRPPTTFPSLSTAQTLYPKVFECPRR